MDLFHGTRTPFDHFLSQYYRTGEGVGNFTGWYFCDTLRGALIPGEFAETPTQMWPRGSRPVAPQTLVASGNEGIASSRV